MTSYHEYNKVDKAKTLVEKLLSGVNIALVTDAGTPGISDPGEELVRQAHEAGICVTSLPGCCACVTALTLSGLPTRRFAFEAFLPQEKKDQKAVLDEMKDEMRTMIVYEAPHRLTKTLKLLLETLGNRRLTVCRELTKKHETVFLTTLEEALEHYQKEAARGECVLVIEGKSYEETKREAQEKWQEMGIEEHVEFYIAQGFEKTEAMKKAAADRGITKREVYRALL
jgi:16S rRNA (cytidine1402-2'-O)-methyltransferase